MNSGQSSHAPVILLIDDNEDHILITQKIIERAYPQSSVIVLMTGRAVKQHLATHVDHLPDLIFLDMDLPDATGLDILREIHKYDDWLDVPVWLLSSWCDDAQLETAYELGIRGYFEKPLDRHGMDAIFHLFEYVNLEVTT
ncbi:response regulator [candidate division KSB1 bacterium]|nr:response regulator [candidate division KSB1 bacterium]